MQIIFVVCVKTFVSAFVCIVSNRTNRMWKLIYVLSLFLEFGKLANPTRERRPTLFGTDHWAAASIWFEIWRVVADLGTKRFDFSRQISEKFRFCKGNFPQNSICLCKFLKTIYFTMEIFERSGKFAKNFDFSGNLKKVDFLGKNC